MLKRKKISASNSRYGKPEQDFKRYVTNHACTSLYQEVDGNK
jgi:hypothetical protein